MSPLALQTCECTCFHQTGDFLGGYLGTAALTHMHTYSPGMDPHRAASDGGNRPSKPAQDVSQMAHVSQMANGTTTKETVTQTVASSPLVALKNAVAQSPCIAPKKGCDLESN